MCETVGTAVGELLNEERVIVMREVRDELTSLKLECAKLATEAATLREALAVDRARVVDMPSPLSRRVN